MTPRIAVVIPVYKHPEFAVEAVRSVIAQDVFDEIAVAISVDGCPLESTHALMGVFPALHSNIHVLTWDNGGPGAARNRAIDYLLARYDSVDSFFFLDADNRLTPTALRRARERLLASDRGWVYPQLKAFGAEWTADYDIGYSSLAHVHLANICDMGSMIRREILDGGVRFDEDRKNGYEDWDFWLQCIRKGWRGQAMADFGLEYRRRAASRLTIERMSDHGAMSHLKRRHDWAATTRCVLALEAEDAPRYFVNLGAGARFFATDPARLAEDKALAADPVGAYWRNRLHPRRRHFPLYQLHLAPSALSRLAEARLLHDAFRNLERALDDRQVARVRCEPHDRTEIEIDADLGAAPHADIVAVNSNFFDECVDDRACDYFRSIGTAAPRPTTCDVILRSPAFADAEAGANAIHLAAGFLEETRASGFANPLNRSELAVHDPIFPLRRDYARIARDAVKSGALRPSLRADARPQVGLVAPFASFGGAERVGYAVCEELRKAGCATHLFVSGAARMDGIDGFTDGFETVNFEWRGGLAQWGGGESYLGNQILLEEHDPESARRVMGMLGDLDMVIVNQAIAPHAVVARLKKMGTRCVFYAHLADRTPLDREVGHPAIAAAFEHAYDLYLTCSAQLRDFMIGLGVPAEKVRHIENSAGYALPPAESERIEAARREDTAHRPLRALYLGRLDPQKGVERLERCVAFLQAEGTEIDWRVVGSELVAEGQQSWTGRFAALGVAITPPIFDPARVAEALEWADVLVLPSRWEGAPLVLFEAMQVGCVPVAVDVGAVAEVIKNGETGLLVGDGEDDRVARELAGALAGLDGDRDKLRALSLAGLRAMRGRGWGDAAADFVAQAMDWLREAGAAADTQP